MYQYRDWREIYFNNTYLTNMDCSNRNNDLDSNISQNQTQLSYNRNPFELLPHKSFISNFNLFTEEDLPTFSQPNLRYNQDIENNLQIKP